MLPTKEYRHKPWRFSARSEPPIPNLLYKGSRQRPRTFNPEVCPCHGARPWPCCRRLEGIGTPLLSTEASALCRRPSGRFAYDVDNSPTHKTLLELIQQRRPPCHSSSARSPCSKARKR